jgi:hypothetical protein
MDTARLGATGPSACWIPSRTPRKRAHRLPTVHRVDRARRPPPDYPLHEDVVKQHASLPEGDDATFAGAVNCIASSTTKVLVCWRNRVTFQQDYCLLCSLLRMFEICSCAHKKVSVE